MGDVVERDWQEGEAAGRVCGRGSWLAKRAPAGYKAESYGSQWNE